MERVKGIEPSQPAWKAGTLPLSYTRIWNWWPIGESNPCYRRERAVSWPLDQWAILIGCGGRTRTYDLRVMSPTSCQLLHSAILNIFGAEDRNRTGTGGKSRRILSPVRLPVPPLRHITWLRLTLPGSCPPSTISAKELNFCVRYGNRCILFAIITTFCVVFIFKTSIIIIPIFVFVNTFF